MTRVSFSLYCVFSGCRWSRVALRDEDEARRLAREHAEGGHAVEVTRETTRMVARYGERIS